MRKSKAGKCWARCTFSSVVSSNSALAQIFFNILSKTRPWSYRPTLLRKQVCYHLYVLLEMPLGGPAFHPKLLSEGLFLRALSTNRFFTSCYTSREFFFNFLFIYLWLCWVFVSVRGLSLVVASGCHSSSRCTGLSQSRPLLLRSTGSRCTGSAIVAHGPSCSVACGIFPDQGSNPCPLH